jgi:threonine dehydratase
MPPTDASPSGFAVAAALDLAGARARVSAVTGPTPLLPAPPLSEGIGRTVLLKLESLQPTGSFKVRGAASRLGALSAEERVRGVVACSSGNHGRAVAWVARRLGIPARVFVPDWVDPVKLDGIRSQGADAVLAGGTYDEAEERAVAHAEGEGRIFVSAYDDPWVIAGQGTLALEVEEQLRIGCPGWWPPHARPAALLAALSGGGLVGGIAAAVHRRGGAGGPVVVAVSAARARVMLESVRAGAPVSLPEEETVASALAGGIGADNRYSFPLIRDLVTDHTVVTEDEITRAISFCYNDLGLIVEGGGAVAVAALRAGRWSADELPEGPVVVVVSGGNVDLATLRRIVAGSG